MARTPELARPEMCRSCVAVGLNGPVDLTSTEPAQATARTEGAGRGEIKIDLATSTRFLAAKAHAACVTGHHASRLRATARRSKARSVQQTDQSCHARACRPGRRPV